MGYACPVCGAEQADAKHLANHLALTSSLGREDHREWLEEYAPDWADCGPEELGEIVSQHAPEIDTPEFEDGPQGQGHDHAHGHDHDPGRPFEDELARQARQPGRGSMTADAKGVLEEARELTRQMQRSSGSDKGVGNGNGNGDGDGDENGDEGADLAAHDTPGRSSGDDEDKDDGDSEHGNENA